MACGSCPGGVTSPEPPPMQNSPDLPPADAVMLEYSGVNIGTFAIAGVAGETLSTIYRFGNNNDHRRMWVRTADAHRLLENYAEQGRPVFSLIDSQPNPMHVAPVDFAKADAPITVPTMTDFLRPASPEAATPVIDYAPPTDAPVARAASVLEDDELTHTPDMKPLPVKAKRARR